MTLSVRDASIIMHLGQNNVEGNKTRGVGGGGVNGAVDDDDGRKRAMG